MKRLKCASDTENGEEPIFIITVLFDYGVFSNSLNGFIFILVGTILVFPLTLFYFKKTM
jgi:hypothetical protein